MPLNCPGVTTVFCLECILSDFLLCIHISCTHLQSREGASVPVSSAHTHSTPQPAFSANKISQASSQASAHAPSRFLPTACSSSQKDYACPLPYSQAARLLPICHFGEWGLHVPSPGAACPHTPGSLEGTSPKGELGIRSLPFLCGSISRQPSNHSTYRGTVPPLATALRSLSLKREFLYSDTGCYLSAYYVLNKLPHDALKTTFSSKGHVSQSSYVIWCRPHTRQHGWERTHLSDLKALLYASPTHPHPTVAPCCTLQKPPQRRCLDSQLFAVKSHPRSLYKGYQLILPPMHLPWLSPGLGSGDAEKNKIMD